MQYCKDISVDLYNGNIKIVIHMKTVFSFSNKTIRENSVFIKLSLLCLFLSEAKSILVQVVS